MQSLGTNEYTRLFTWERPYHFGENSYLGEMNIISGMYLETIFNPNVSIQLAYMYHLIKSSAFAEKL